MIGRRLVLGVLVVLALFAGACATGGDGGRPTRTPESGALRVVTTTTVFADLVAQIGGTRVDVASLVPKGGEVHTFDPTPGDLQKVARAQVLIANGLGLDDWLVGLASDAGTSATLVMLADSVSPGERIDDPDGSSNPHVWLDVAVARGYVAFIADALSKAAPADAATFEAGATAFSARLAALDTSIRGRLAAIPEDHRKVISFHDAFPYFARAYGLDVVGTVVDAPGQDPSAGEIAKLVAAVEANGVAAIIAEAQFNDDLVRTLADETGAKVVSDLYDDTLGDPPVDTYEGMMSWDTDKLVAALGG